MDDNDQLLRTRRPPVLLEGLQVRYPGADGLTLDGVDLFVAPGQFVSVVGASGAGKSTLLKVLTGQLRPSAGTAVVAGVDMTHLPARRLPRVRRRLGITFQEARLLPARTAAQNIEYALALTGVRPARARDMAADALERVGISHLADRYPPAMSGGEAQRVQIARAVADRPFVLLADEPTGNLDPGTTAEIVEVLAGVADAGTAVVMVTHDVAAVDQLHRRVVHLEAGRVVADTHASTYELGLTEPAAQHRPRWVNR